MQQFKLLLLETLLIGATQAVGQIEIILFPKMGILSLLSLDGI